MVVLPFWLTHQYLTDNDLQTCLQAIAIRISCQKNYNRMFYLPTSNVKMDKNDLEDLINQLPPPIVLLGDFNAQCT